MQTYTTPEEFTYYPCGLCDIEIEAPADDQPEHCTGCVQLLATGHDELVRVVRELEDKLAVEQFEHTRTRQFAAWLESQIDAKAVRS